MNGLTPVGYIKMTVRLCIEDIKIKNTRLLVSVHTKKKTVKWSLESFPLTRYRFFAMLSVLTRQFVVNVTVVYFCVPANQKKNFYLGVVLSISTYNLNLPGTRGREFAPGLCVPELRQHEQDR